MKYPIWLYITALFCLAAVGCSTGKTQRVDVDDDIAQDTELSSKDLRSMSRKMAEDLLQCPQIKDRINQKMKPAMIAFAGLTNETRDYDFSPKETLLKIRGYLIQYSRGYVTFLESEKLEQTIENYTGSKVNDKESIFVQNPYLEKADYLLTGNAYAKKQQTKDMVTKYHSYTFWLTHVPTRTIVWQNEYEVKKAAEMGTLYERN